MEEIKETESLWENPPTEDMIRKDRIAGHPSTRWAANRIYCYKETDSTNIRAKNLALQGASHGTLVVAESQTQGRGRRGRVWESLQGDSIYMTIILRPSISPSKASMLTLVMAYSVAESLKELYGEKSGNIQIKWPNDIVCNKKKVTGILTEMSAEVDQINYVIIGVGLNLNFTEIPEELKEKATSLFLETGIKQERNQVIAKIMEHFEKDYENFFQSGNLKFLQEDYEKLLVNKDAQVRVLDAKGDYEGIARGINEEGELLIEKDGRIIPVYAGEVSVRGIYGYVE